MTTESNTPGADGKPPKMPDGRPLIENEPVKDEHPLPKPATGVGGGARATVVDHDGQPSHTPVDRSSARSTVAAEADDHAPPADFASGDEEAAVAADDRPAPAPGRYASTRNHRMAADTKGRTMSESDFKSLSRRSLLTGVVGAAAALVGWRTIQGRPADDNIPDVLRDVHQANESIWRGLFRGGAEAPEFDFSESSFMRVNGRHGIRDDLNLATWELVVVGRDGERLGTHGVEDLREMEQIEMTVEHYCVEGWSHIVTWGGVRFSDFVERFYPDEAQARFVGLATPDNEYRVGLDMDSMLHSQTMLTLDLQREPLTEEHGAPVRLTTPLKYGIKQIKRIGTIEFSDTQPEGDYWATRGYDWYAGL